MNANMPSAGGVIELPSVIENINIAYASRFEKSLEHVVLGMTRAHPGPILQTECKNRSMPSL